MDIERFQRLPEMYVNAVTPEYFATIGTRIVRGRGIDASDVAGAPDAIVVSNSLARALWPGKDAIGQCVILSANTPRACGYVVGIAEDIKQTGFQNDPGLMYYRAVAQWYDRNIAVIVRMGGPAGPAVETVRQALQREMPGASYVRVSQLADRVRAEMKSWQLGATMFVAFGGLALVLAAIGLYSVVSYNMAQRTHEMGVRRALGAQPGDVVGLVVRQGLMLGGVGVAVGTAVTFAASGAVAPMLFDVSPRDPMIYAFAAGAMFVVAAAASAIPAIRAARVDPNVALRAD
jgi:ABC-type antimicrobial peptide transport system permease subunit